MAEYLTKEGDVLDQIAYKYYGNTNNRVNAVVQRSSNLDWGYSQ